MDSGREHLMHATVPFDGACARRGFTSVGVGLVGWWCAVFVVKPLSFVFDKTATVVFVVFVECLFGKL